MIVTLEHLCTWYITHKTTAAKQYGTDQNDGDPQYAFYRVFKSADPRIEQVDSNTIPKQLAELLQGVELYKFTWAPQRSAGKK